MFARVSTYTGTSDEIDEAIRQFRENVLPSVEQLDGFKGSYFLVDRQNGKSLTVALWEIAARKLRTSENSPSKHSGE